MKFRKHIHAKNATCGGGVLESHKRFSLICTYESPVNCQLMRRTMRSRKFLQDCSTKEDLVVFTDSTSKAEKRTFFEGDMQ